MSDDERREEEPEEAPREATPPPAPPAPKPKPPPAPRDDEDGDGNEAAARFAEDQKRRKERDAEELKEYEEMRREEKAKEEEEIAELRQRRERRKQERAEEEKRLAEMRAIEEKKRRAEEEERQARKREEEAKRREDRERKKQELESSKERMGKPNFVITKKGGGETVQVQAKAKGTLMNKTKEQLDQERKTALEARCIVVNTSGMDEAALKTKAKELYDRLYQLESDKYDAEQNFKRRQYDMTELAERARQMNKGGNKNKQKTQENVEVDKLAEKLTGIPPKLIMYSPYERVMDHRSFGERKDVYFGPQYGDPYVRVMPQYKVGFGEAGFEFTDPWVEEEGAKPAAAPAAAPAPAKAPSPPPAEDQNAAEEITLDD